MNTLNLEVVQTAPGLNDVIGPYNLWIVLFNYWVLVRRELKSLGRTDDSMDLHVSWYQMVGADHQMNLRMLDSGDNSGDWRQNGILVSDSFKASVARLIDLIDHDIRNATRSIVMFSMGQDGGVSSSTKRRAVMLHYADLVPFENEPFALTIQYRSNDFKQSQRGVSHLLPKLTRDPFEVSVHTQWDLVGTMGHRKSVSIQKFFHPVLDWNRHDLLWTAASRKDGSAMERAYHSALDRSLLKARMVSIALLKALEETSVLGLDKLVISDSLNKFAARFDTGTPFGRFVNFRIPVDWESITSDMLFPLQEHLSP